MYKLKSDAVMLFKNKGPRIKEKGKRIRVTVGGKKFEVKGQKAGAE